MASIDESLSKCNSNRSDLEAQPTRSRIQFTDDVRNRDKIHEVSSNRRPSFQKRLSNASFEPRKIDPSVALPPLFKSVSYRIDDDAVSVYSTNKADKKVQDFRAKSWHFKSISQVETNLDTSATDGLRTAQHADLLKSIGPNIHSKPPSNWLKKFFFYLFGGFGSLLMISGVLCCIAWKPLGDPPATANLVLGLVLFMVFIAQALFNFWQDFSSAQVMKSITGMLPSEVTVVRDGARIIDRAENLVPGDLIFITNGDKLPADVRFSMIEGGDFAFDRSILTGESVPCYATDKPDKPDSNYLESSSIGLQGTFCVGGSGYGIVVATGDSTVFGQLAKLSSQPKSGLSPLQREILRFVLIIISIVLFFIVLVCILWAVWIDKQYPGKITVPTLIVNLVSVSVAFIPEGLPIAMTTCLIIIANVMRRNNILCKSLGVIETLGSVSTLCSDKTGTLTKNKMFVTNYSIGVKQHSVTDTESEDSEKSSQTHGMFKVGLVARLCNSATWSPTTLHLPINERLVTGSNATDQAILRFGETMLSELPPAALDQWVSKLEISFNSKNKFMVRLIHNQEEKHYTLMIKGAPDVLLPKCTKTLDAGGVEHTFTSEHKTAAEKLQDDWSVQGQRVVLIASKQIDFAEFEEIEFKSKQAIDKLLALSQDGLTLNGLVGINDPPKDDIFNVVSTLKGAGIRVYMVTGDFETTAIAIAIQCGILRETATHSNIKKLKDLDPNYPIPKEKAKLCDRIEIDDFISLSGADIEKMNENQWEQLTLFKEIVFSRTTPEHKLKIVQQFQSNGHLVAMTGDGVNDAPSLKQADIGIAMAEGSEIAKESADLVLLDSFSSIVQALKYGRLVFENIRKTIAYLIPAGTYAELWAIILSIIFGFPQILSSFCMIIICCLTDCAAAMTIAYEAPERDLLLKAPRTISGERLIDMRFIFHCYICIGTYEAFVACFASFLYFSEHNVPFDVLSLSFGSYPAGYSADRIDELNKCASSIYFITLVILQLFNLMCVRTRTLSIFQQPPLFNKETQNLGMIAAMAFAIAVPFFFNYVPWFQENLMTAIVPAKYYFIALAFGLLLLTYDELRKWYVRGHPKSLLAKMAW